MTGQSAIQKFDSLNDYIEYVRKRHTNYMAVIINLSVIEDEAFRNSYKNIFCKILVDLCKTFEGKLFTANNGVLILVIRSLGASSVDKRIGLLRDIIGRDDDFLILARISSLNEITRVYHFQTGFDGFMRDVIYLLAPNQLKEGQTSRLLSPAEGEFHEAPLSVRQIARAEEFIPTLNLSTYMEMQSVYMVGPDIQPEKLFTHISMKHHDLLKTLVPEQKLEESGRLEKYILQLSEKRLLRLLAIKSINLGQQPLAIPFSSNTLFSLEFLSYHINQQWREDNFLVVTMDLMDVLDDIENFEECRDFVRQKGHIFAIDHFHINQLKYIQAGYFDCDFLFVDLPESISYPEQVIAREELATLLKTIGSEKVVLSNCLNEKMLQAGVESGGLLFMGPKIDAVIRLYQRQLSMY